MSATRDQGPQAQDQYAGDTSRSPVVGFTVASLICAFLSVGIIASYLPRPSPLQWSVALLVASVLLLIGAVVSLFRRRPFAWWLFYRVAGWLFLVTLVFTAVAVFVLVYDRTPPATLAIMAVVLLLSATDIPLAVAFSVARHERDVQQR